MRKSTIKRTTKETDISLSLCLDTAGEISTSTGIGFFDHMLNAMAFHGGFSLSVEVDGDLEVDMHHTVEDVGIVLGQAIKEALGDRVGITRFCSMFTPMDEALAFCCIDVSARPYLVFHAPMFGGALMPNFDLAMVEEFFYAVATNAGLTLHLKMEYGQNPHHMVEAMFKSFGRALGGAVEIKDDKIRSTKGTL